MIFSYVIRFSIWLGIPAEKQWLLPFLPKGHYLALLYRLRMFETLLNAYPSKICRETVVASFALEKADRYKKLAHFLNSSPSNKVYESLLYALAYYDPALVSSLLEKRKLRQPHLHFALLNHLNKTDELKAILLNNSPLKGEIALVENGLTQCNEKKLARLNQLLQAQGLTPLQLRVPYLPPNVVNFSTAIDVSLTEKSQPLVSIIITAYNVETYIEQAIRSYLNQTYKHIEIIVVDDGSEDGTLAIVKKLASKYSQVKWQHNPINQGTYVCKHLGIKQAKGEFIQCHDSDDFAHPQKIEKQIQPLLDNPNLVATFSLWLRLDEQGVVRNDHIYPFMRENPSSCLFRKSEVLAKMPLWQKVRIGADSEFNARLRLHFPRRVKRLPLLLTIGSFRAESLTQQKTRKTLLARQTYWEAWRKAHIHQLKHRKKI